MMADIGNSGDGQHTQQLSGQNPLYPMFNRHSPTQQSVRRAEDAAVQSLKRTRP